MILLIENEHLSTLCIGLGPVDNCQMSQTDRATVTVFCGETYFVKKNCDRCLMSLQMKMTKLFYHN